MQMISYEMAQFINQVIKNPGKPIHIPEDFQQIKLQKVKISNLLIQNIKTIFYIFLQQIRFIFSFNYKMKFNQAIDKINAAYDEKIKKIDHINKELNAIKGLKTEITNQKKLLKNCKKICRHSEKAYDLKQKEILKFEARQAQLETLENSNFFYRYYYKSEINSCRGQISARGSLSQLKQAAKQCGEKHALDLNKKEEVEKKIKELKLRKQTLSIQIENNVNKTSSNMPQKRETSHDTDSRIAFQKMVAELPKFTSDILAQLWIQLLKNAKDIHSLLCNWNCNKQGCFCIQLKAPLKLWINSPEPKGGCIFLLGNNDRLQIKGRLYPQSIKFDKGFYSYCYHKITFFNKQVTPKMIEIEKTPSGMIKISGTFMGITQSRIYHKTALLKEWESIEIVPNNYPNGHGNYLENKFKQVN